MISITLIIIILTVLVSIKAFSDSTFKGKLIFHPYTISEQNEYFRFLTSGFLHADWMHLIINMYVFYAFGEFLEFGYDALFGKGGKILYVAMYLSAIIMANVSTYFKHKDNPRYASLGASGAVSAVVFATIIINPGMEMGLLFIPIHINAVIFGALYLIYSFVMSRRSYGNINHEAHFYGAIYGILFTVVLKPAVFMNFINELTSWL